MEFKYSKNKIKYKLYIIKGSFILTKLGNLGYLGKFVKYAN